MSISEKAFQDYKNSITSCPLCELDDLTEAETGFNMEGHTIWINMHCLACDGRWAESYELTKAERL